MADSILIPVRPCVKCGAAERYSNGSCKACSRKASAAWQARYPEKNEIAAAKYRKLNPEKVKNGFKEWYGKNPEKIKAKTAAYYAANKDRLRHEAAEWRKANPEKVKASIAAWAAANREKINASKKARHDKNPNKENEVRAVYRDANREKVRAAERAYRAANPEKSRLAEHTRRARKKAVGGKLSPGLSKKLMQLQKGMCLCCALPLGDDFHLDHVMPLALGGTNTDDNIQLLHSLCNQKKRSTHPVEFMQRRGFLL